MTKMYQLKNSFIGFNIVNEESKTIILILPGGAYETLSWREGWPIATRFNTFGYNTAVLYYRIAPCAGLAPLEDGLDALEYLSKEYDNIITCGFSAGGHLSACLASLGAKYNLKASIMCYPVISLFDDGHIISARNFLGELFCTEYQTKYSAQNLVSSSTVPSFLWTTYTDQLVPYTNTLLMVDKLNEYHIYNEYRIYSCGVHGLALADMSTTINNDMTLYNEEVQSWVTDAKKFIEKILKEN